MRVVLVEALTLPERAAFQRLLRTVPEPTIICLVKFGNRESVLWKRPFPERKLVAQSHLCEQVDFGLRTNQGGHPMRTKPLRRDPHTGRPRLSLPVSF